MFGATERHEELDGSGHGVGHKVSAVPRVIGHHPTQLTNRLQRKTRVKFVPLPLVVLVPGHIITTLVQVLSSGKVKGAGLT